MLMPPNSTRSRLTFASSGLVGVYNGRSVTSCPRASSSTASALSREQLPQYMPAAPAVSERIFTRAPASYLRRLERPRAEEEIYQVTLVRLQPVQLRRRHRTDVQPVHVDGVDQRAPQRRAVRQR